MPRDHALRIDDIIAQIQRAQRLTAGVDLSGFSEDEARTYATVFCLIAIGESAGHLSTEWTDEHPEVPWRQIRAMRNILVHEYFRIDVEMIWLTATQRLPPLLTLLEALAETSAE